MDYAHGSFAVSFTHILKGVFLAITMATTNNIRPKEIVSNRDRETENISEKSYETET